jgi:hypothetical protein
MELESSSPYPQVPATCVPQNFITVFRTSCSVTVTDLHVCTDHFTANQMIFSRTFHVSVFIVQYRCESCAVEGISGWNGRHERRERVLYSEGKRHNIVLVWLIDGIFRAKLYKFYSISCSVKCTKFMVGWRGHALRPRFLFVILNNSLGTQQKTHCNFL